MRADMAKYRDDIPPVPIPMLGLPVQDGYPVPWFVAKVSKTRYDFRCIDAAKIPIAVRKKKCWVCGNTFHKKEYTFPIGPMSAINRIISEPPSHKECAIWSARACPFLIQQRGYRNPHEIPAATIEAAGIPILRQPGAVCIWVTDSYKPVRAPNGVLYALGEPTEVLWMRQGRAATRAEVLESIDSGYPELEALAQQEGAVAQLEAAKAIALELIPKE